MPFQIFSGVYNTFAETKAVDRPFESSRWFESSRKKVQTAYRKGVVSEESLLPMLAALNCRDNRVRIIDFGGGLGVFFPLVDGVLPAGVKLDFHVVDTAASCRQGRACHSEEQRIHFHDQMPDNLEDVQIIHLGSVLQYVDEWQDLLYRLARYKAPYILLSDAMVGNIPTFITVQDYYGQKIPFRFTNLDELTKFFQNQLGYSLKFKAKYVSTIQGVEGFYNMDNLPAEYRLDLPYTLLFQLD
jgi:putative methyltransferase (TIGR04325 family)